MSNDPASVPRAWQIRMTYGVGSPRSFIHDRARAQIGQPLTEAAKINAAKDAYVRGAIELDEFECQVGEILRISESHPHVNV